MGELVDQADRITGKWHQSWAGYPLGAWLNHTGRVCFSIQGLKRKITVRRSSGRCNPWEAGRGHVDRRHREQRYRDAEIAWSVLVAVRQSHVQGLEFEQWYQSKRGAKHGSWAKVYVSVVDVDLNQSQGQPLKIQSSFHQHF